jgi:hypothetical protein
VDNRLRRPEGRRITHLRKRDLPELAKALVSVVYKQGWIIFAGSGSPAYVRLHGNGFDVSVSLDDWRLIQPYINDGTFDPLRFPGPQVVTLNPNDFLSQSVVDLNAETFYKRVLGALQQVFSEEYPTARL